MSHARQTLDRSAGALSTSPQAGYFTSSQGLWTLWAARIPTCRRLDFQDSRFSLEGGFIEGLGSQVIETINGFLDEAPPCFWITAEHYLHGAASLPAVHERAFSLRRRGYTTRIFAGWTSPGEADRSAAWVKRLNTALARFSDGALYTNYLTGVEGDAGVRAAYGTNYDRLVALKNRYDPDNFFSSNRNIKPDSTLR